MTFFFPYLQFVSFTFYLSSSKVSQMKSSRRHFLHKAVLGAAGLSIAANLPARVLGGPNHSQHRQGPSPASTASGAPGELFFKIAVSQFSFASQFWTKKLDPLDFPAKSKELGIAGLDFCSMFFADKAKDQAYLAQL